MGRYKNSGLAHGTKGSPQKCFDNYELEIKVKLLEKQILNEKKTKGERNRRSREGKC